MRLRIGQYIDEENGNVYDRYLLMGRLIKDAEFDEVGENKTSRLRITINVSRFDPLCELILWSYDANEYAGIKKGSVVFADAIEKTREYKEKRYISYAPMFMIVDPKRSVPAGSGSKRSKTVKPGDPNDGFTDIINREDLPF